MIGELLMSSTWNEDPISISVPTDYFLYKYHQDRCRVGPYKDYVTVRGWRKNFRAGRLYWDDGTKADVKNVMDIDSKI